MFIHLTNLIILQIILVTDGGAGMGPTSLGALVQTLSRRPGEEEARSEEKLQLPFIFPCKLHVLCVGDAAQLQQQGTISLYQKLIDLNKQQGIFWFIAVPDFLL